MAKSKGGPQNEPGNPDGCIIGKKEAKTLTASVELLSDAFLSGAQSIRTSLTLLSDTISEMALKIRKVSEGFNRTKKTANAKKEKGETAQESGIKATTANRANANQAKEKPGFVIRTFRSLFGFSQKGQHPGSIYTHDIHTEKILEKIASAILAAESKQKERKVKSKPKSKKEKTDLDLQIDELRSKFPILTKLFIDGPAKLKEEFKYWSGVMATGWGFASSVTKDGAKLLRKGWDIAYKAMQSKPEPIEPVKTIDNAKNEPNDLKKEEAKLISKIEKSQSKFNSIFKNFKDTIESLKTKSATDPLAASALLALNELAKSLGRVDAKEFQDKFDIAKKAISDFAGDLPIRAEDPTQNLTEAEKNLADFTHKMTLETPLKIATQSNNSILENIKRLGEVVNDLDSGLTKKRKKKKEDPRKHVTLASGGPATLSKDDAKGTDTVPAMLTPGEFVVNKDATKKNRGMLEQINNGGKTQKKASGGQISYLAKGTPSSGGSGPAPSGPAPAAAVSPFIAGLTLAGKSLGVLSTVGNLAVGAITGTVGAFNQITAFAGSFVQAFNPALMEQMNLVFKDLTAVIGMGLEPVIGAVIPIVRAFADRLVPVMQAMIPTVQLFADSMIELSGPIIEILIQAFAALEPIIVMAAGVVEMWAGVLTWAVPLISTVIKEIVYWFTKIVSTVQYVVGSLMIAIGKVLAMVPGTGNAGKDLQKVGENAIESSKKASKATDDYYNGTSKVQKAIQKPMIKGASVGAAAGKASFSGISDLGRNLMQSAMSSSTQASAIRTAENTEKMDKTLQEINMKMGRAPADPARPARGLRAPGVV